MAEYTGGSPQAEHLCVLVHGLWGNPEHMKNVARRLRAEYPAEQLYILVAKRNSGSFTYDGIELGGERLCREIEEQLDEITSKGGNIKKLSIAGYSLGGLVARYAIGLLYSKGVLDQLECQNFTAFASPFLGVRSPLRGWANQLFNVLGARTLSKSGHQLFTIDTFRDTGRPLLAVLADPKSIFMQGLAKFKRRTLYTNIINDRTAVHYTTGITKTDPYTDLTRVKVNYLKGYEPVILDPANPVSALPNEELKQDFQTRARAFASNLPFVLALSVFLPVGVVAFLITAAVQTVRSSKRIELHEKGLAGIDIRTYRGVPLIIKEIRNQIEDAYEELNSSQNQAYLAPASSRDGSSGAVGAKEVVDSEEEEDYDDEPAPERKRSRGLSSASLAAPTLALTEEQFEMIEGLDGLGWRKYPVWIHKVRHSHAAIVVRSDKASFSEGEVVLSHWAQEEFLL